jgi:hypothetical protein
LSDFETSRRPLRGKIRLYVLLKFLHPLFHAGRILVAKPPWAPDFALPVKCPCLHKSSQHCLNLGTGFITGKSWFKAGDALPPAFFVFPSNHLLFLVVGVSVSVGSVPPKMGGMMATQQLACKRFEVIS